MKKRKMISLNIKVLILSLAVMIIPMVIIGSMLYRKSIVIVQQKQEISVRNSFQSIADSLEVIMDNVHNVSLFLIQDDTIRNMLSFTALTKSELLEQQNAILSSLGFFTRQNTYIEDISIEGENGVGVIIGGGTEKVGEEILADAQQRKGGPVWSWNRAEGNNRGRLSLTREINNIEKPSEKLGMMHIEVSDSVIHEQLKNYIQSYPGYISVLNEKGESVCAYGTPLAENENLEEIYRKLDEGNGWFENADYKDNIVSYYYRIPGREWCLVSSIKLTDLYMENYAIRNLLILGVVISIFLCLLIVLIFAKSILRPLRLLTEKMEQITEENYSISLDIRSNDEIGLLSKCFNKMAKRLDELINEVLKGEVLYRDAQLKALQAQINPHFLYNNLDTAYWMSRLEHAEKTGKIILALSDLYRLTVSAPSKLVSVETEVHYMNNYILIQQMRLGDMAEFSVEVEDETLSDATVKFVIQPMLENSIQHGILPAGVPGKISIRIYQKEGVLYFVVSDTGRDASVQRLTEILNDTSSEEKRGMALRNIDQRIKLQFGQEYGLHFEKTEEKGICAVIMQPVVPYQSEHDGTE